MKTLPLSTFMILALGCTVSAQNYKKEFYYSFVQSFGTKAEVPQYPFGFEVGYLAQISESPFHLGFSGLYQNYDKTTRDEIKTSHNIHRIGLDFMLDLVTVKKLTVSLRGSLGASSVSTRSYTGVNEVGQVLGSIIIIFSYLDDDEENDIETEIPPLRVMRSFRRFSADYGFSLKADWSFSPTNKIFFESGMRYLGSTDYILPESVQVTPGIVRYQFTRSTVSFLDFKVGISHVF